MAEQRIRISCIQVNSDIEHKQGHYLLHNIDDNQCWALVVDSVNLVERLWVSTKIGEAKISRQEISVFLTLSFNHNCAPSQYCHINP